MSIYLCFSPFSQNRELLSISFHAVLGASKYCMAVDTVVFAAVSFGGGTGVCLGDM